MGSKRWSGLSAVVGCRWYTSCRFRPLPTTMPDDLFSELNGPDQPPQVVDDDYQYWAIQVIHRAVPNYMLREKGGFVLDRIVMEIAKALRQFYEMGQKGTPLGLIVERRPDE